MTREERNDAERACARLINSFCVTIDSGRFDAMSRLFTTEATFNRPSETQRVLAGRAAILADFSARPQQRSAHLALNIIVDVQSPDRATAISYIAAASTPLDGAAPAGVPVKAPLRIGVFEDEFHTQEGEWRIARRSGRMLLIAGG